MPVPERIRTSHPRYAAGATTREKNTIDRLHGAATTSHHPEAAAIMLEGVELIVALVKQRGVGQAFIRAIDEHNENAG